MYQWSPYTQTESIANCLTKIVETATRLEIRTDFNRDIRLHRENRVESIYSSLAIEGNTLSLDEVTDVIIGKFRRGDVGVFDGNMVIHMGARPQFVPERIAELFGRVNEAKLHPVTKRQGLDPAAAERVTVSRMKKFPAWQTGRIEVRQKGQDKLRSLPQEQVKRKENQTE